GEIHLALVDLTLPDGSGMELVEQAKRIVPQLVAVVMSGTPPDSPDEFIRRGVDEYLTKPFSFEELDHVLSRHERYIRAALEIELLKQRLHREDKNQAFFYEAGHQLKTPIAVMKEFAHLFQEGFGGELSAKQGEYLDAIHQNIDRLLYLVENIEMLSRLDSGSWIIRLEEEDPREIVSQVSASWRPILERRDLHLVEDVPARLPKVRTDAAAVQQVLFNLVDNASKYGPARGTVTLRCFQPDEGTVRIDVEDEGEAIPADKRDVLFLPFARLPEHESAPGLGLGLTVARGLMQRMDGVLWLADGASDGNGPAGNRFCIQLPVAPDPS
ncbi:MAG: ATP-binding protein, partial [Candidatus Neomarinimicrobiota bacterium]